MCDAAAGRRCGIDAAAQLCNLVALPIELLLLFLDHRHRSIELIAHGGSILRVLR